MTTNTIRESERRLPLWARNGLDYLAARSNAQGGSVVPDNAGLQELYANCANDKDVSAYIVEAVVAHEKRFAGWWSCSPSASTLPQLRKVGETYGAGLLVPASVFGEETERELAVEVQRQQEKHTQPPAEVPAEEVDLPRMVCSDWAAGQDSAWVTRLTSSGAKPLQEFVSLFCRKELHCISWGGWGGWGGSDGGGSGGGQQTTRATTATGVPPVLLLTRNCFVTLHRDDLTGSLRLLDAFVVAPALRT